MESDQSGFKSHNRKLRLQVFLLFLIVVWNEEIKMSALHSVSPMFGLVQHQHGMTHLIREGMPATGLRKKFNHFC